MKIKQALRFENGKRKKVRKPRLVEIWKYCIALEIILALEMLYSELGSQRPYVPRPTWRQNPCSLETICLGMVEDKSIQKRCINAWLRSQKIKNGLECYQFYEDRDLNYMIFLEPPHPRPNVPCLVFCVFCVFGANKLLYFLVLYCIVL